MNKWKKIAEIRQDRINELKDDVEHYRSESLRLAGVIDEWRDVVGELREIIETLKD